MSAYMKVQNHSKDIFYNKSQTQEKLFHAVPAQAHLYNDAKLQQSHKGAYSLENQEWWVTKLICQSPMGTLPTHLKWLMDKGSKYMNMYLVNVYHTDNNK